LILYFLRHADAVAAGQGDDEGRQLSPDGEAAMRAAAPVWRRLNLRPDVVASSPLPRALRTAQLLSEGIGLSRPPLADERLRPGAGWGEMARVIGAHPAARRVLFVGHEPDLSQVVALLTGAASVRMRKGGLACVEFPGTPEPGSGELAWLIDPDLYEASEEGGETQPADLPRESRKRHSSTS
jgi:phosphohistidine phosphatase